jgi:hypothetical protein
MILSTETEVTSMGEKPRRIGFPTWANVIRADRKQAKTLLDENSHGPFSKSAPSIHLVQIVTVEQIALERFNHRADLPFGSVFIIQKVLDTIPADRTVKLASLPLVEELTMLLTYIFLVFFAVFDFHFAPPFAVMICDVQSPEKMLCYFQYIFEITN